ncbi:hypothetical protein D3C76_472380 [compost metagenome]
MPNASAVIYLFFDHFRTLGPKSEFTTVHAKKTGVTNDSLAFLNSLTAFQFWESGIVVSTHYS